MTFYDSLGGLLSTGETLQLYDITDNGLRDVQDTRVDPKSPGYGYIFNLDDKNAKHREP